MNQTPKESAQLKWPKLLSGKLIKRYKRFLADVELGDGAMVTAHCPNSGSMRGCSEAGRLVYLSQSTNPRRKLKFTWELIKMPSSLVGVNTLIPNRLVHQSLLAERIPELKGYKVIQREAKVGQRSRLDFRLQHPKRSDCYVEVKNCTLVEKDTAYFPDAVTARGLKHLVEMQKLMADGNRCVMFYLIQRTDAAVFQPADHIDAAYSQELRNAVSHGLEVLCYDVHIDKQRIAINRKIPHRF